MNNSKANASNIPEFQLRWLVIETEKEYNTSWLSSKSTQTYIERSKPILQYSNDGVQWLDVPTVIERVKGD